MKSLSLNFKNNFWYDFLLIISRLGRVFIGGMGGGRRARLLHVTTGRALFIGLAMKFSYLAPTAIRPKTR